MQPRVEAIDDAMEAVTTSCQSAVRDIWAVADCTEGAYAEGYQAESLGRPPGADGVFWESQVETASKKEPPDVKIWKGVGLLGGG